MRDKLPPHDVAAEEAVLAALLLDEGAYPRVLPILQPADFFREQNGWIYEGCLALGERAEAITVPAVAHEMERSGRLDEAGGEPYLADLVGRHFTSAGVETHARIVRNCARLRRTISAAAQIAEAAYQNQPATETIEYGLAVLGDLLEDGDTGLERLGSGDLDIEPGLHWGIPILDHRTMGVCPGDLSIIAGGSGQGKSMLAAQIARNVAQAGGRVTMWSTEMSNHRYALRMAHAISGTRSRDNLYDPPYTEPERTALAAGLAAVRALDIESSMSRGASAATIAAAARLHDAARHVDLVVVDYLQMLAMPKSDTDAAALKATTAAFKRLANDLQCHVLLVSQINRSGNAEMRQKESIKMECIVTGNKYPRPVKEYLMGGAVENDADLVVMLQRHTACPGHHMQIVIAKNRNGREGDGMLWANFGLARFESLTRDQVEHEAHGDMTIYRALMRDQGYDDPPVGAATAADGGWIGAQ